MKSWQVVVICILSMIPMSVVAANAPSMALDRTEHDFGDVQEGTEVKTSFVVSNAGNAPLVIDDVRTSCGCTGAVAGSRQVPPGGSTQITVSYDAAGASPGDKNHGVLIHCNDPNRPVAQLQIHVHVVK
jgi:hypothetical protein